MVSRRAFVGSALASLAAAAPLGTSAWVDTSATGADRERDAARTTFDAVDVLIATRPRVRTVWKPPAAFPAPTPIAYYAGRGGDGASPDDLAQADALLVLTISGFDDNSAQQLNARRSYPADHIRWQHRYVDISSNADDGRLVLDYGKFHDVRPEEDHDAGAAPSGA